ncbi:MAG: hypothetical protein HKN43_16210 [Rhodothermales bacterium]|nr:hypothetical protein [Rhodothermales bacterium]
MLIVPVISLLDDLAVDYLERPLSVTDCSFDEPVKMARLWRVQNAKVIHITDRVSQEVAAPARFSAIRRIRACLDIPIQLETDFDRVLLDEALSSVNVARCIIRINETTVDELAEAIERFGASRVCGLINHPPVSTNADSIVDDFLTQIESVVATGCRRLILRDSTASNQLEGYNRSLLTRVAKHFPRVRFSASGGVGSYKELKLLQIAAPRNVDSVIIGRALYENTFPCQKFWCWHQKDTVNLDEYSSASLREE